MKTQIEKKKGNYKVMCLDIRQKKTHPRILIFLLINCCSVCKVTCTVYQTLQIC